MDIQYIKGVGPALAKKLAKLELKETSHALLYFPHSYQDRRIIPTIQELVPGKDSFVTGRVRTVSAQKRGRFHLTQAIIEDKSGRLKAVWFNQPFIKKVLKPEVKIFINGKVEVDELSQSKTIRVSEYEFVDEKNVGRIIPIYPLTKGVYQKQLRTIIERCLEKEIKNISDPFPGFIREKYNLAQLKYAIFYYHYPKDEDTYKKAKYRLIFEDFFYLQLSLAISKKLSNKREKGLSFVFKNTITKKYFESLPYKLTNAQQRVIDEVRSDMMSEYPMNRMVQGDVGAGKTEVAMAAILNAVENDYQVAIMAPTEILAYQHYQKMLKYLLPLGIRVELLVGSLSPKNKTRKQYLISSGEAQVAVGTQALIQKKVDFANLGLAIIDEQHRFGVMQRSALKCKSGKIVDLLVLTATPIPRTLTLTLYGDLDKSILNEMPPGRHPIETVWLKKITRDWIIKIKSELDKGNQAYWVFPLVTESEKIDLKAATEGSKYLQDKVFSKYKVGLLHGKMKQAEKDEVIKKFRAKQINVLVATTVIEVGVDVPDSTIMVIEHAERFGLSQLHQLRGRIGRSDKQAWCILLSGSRTQVCKRRLGALVDTTDGFKLAEVDLELRGPGDYFGAKQSGLPTMHVANLIKDEPVLLLAKKVAKEISDDLENPDFKPAIMELKKKPHLFVGLEGMN